MSAKARRTRAATRRASRRSNGGAILAPTMSAARVLTVYEPFRSIFYAPQFVALYGRHFAAEGLDVTVVTAGGRGRSPPPPPRRPAADPLPRRLRRPTRRARP